LKLFERLCAPLAAGLLGIDTLESRMARIETHLDPHDAE
jgi:hypothetical protein